MTSSIEIREESARVAALKYLKRQLGLGKTLSKLLLDSVAFENGEILALSAVALNFTEATQFESGHARRANTPPQHIVIGELAFTAHSTPGAEGQLAQTIHSLLSEPGSLCLLESSLARAGDPWLARAKSRVLFHGSEVYHALFSTDRDEMRIVNAIHEAERPPLFVGAVGCTPPDMPADISSFSTITAEQLANFAESVRCVFVRAYDGEGYLVIAVQPAKTF
jgi:hypothetical protein